MLPWTAWRLVFLSSWMRSPLHVEIECLTLRGASVLFCVEVKTIVALEWFLLDDTGYLLNVRFGSCILRWWRLLFQTEIFQELRLAKMTLEHISPRYPLQVKEFYCEVYEDCEPSTCAWNWSKWEWSFSVASHSMVDPIFLIKRLCL